MVSRLLFHLSLLLLLASPLYGASKSPELDEDTYTQEKTKNLGIEKLGSTIRTEKDEKLQAAQSRYANDPAGYRRVAKKIDQEMFVAACKKVVNEKIAKTSATLRYQIMLQLKREIDKDPKFSSKLLSKFPSLREEEFRTFFDTMVAVYFHLWVPEYLKMQAIVEKIRRPLVLPISVEDEKSLAASLHKIERQQISGFFSMPRHPEALTANPTMDVNFATVKQKAQELLGSIPADRATYLEGKRREQEAEARRQAVKKKADDLENAAFHKRTLGIDSEMRAAQKERDRQDKEKARQQKKADDLANAPLRAAQKREHRAQQWKEFKSGARTVGKYAGLAAASPVLVPGYLGYKAGLGLYKHREAIGKGALAVGTVVGGVALSPVLIPGYLGYRAGLGIYNNRQAIGRGALAAGEAIGSGTVAVGKAAGTVVASPYYAGKYAGSKIHSSWKDYQANAPDRERRRQENKRIREERAIQKQSEQERQKRQAQVTKEAAQERKEQERVAQLAKRQEAAEASKAKRAQRWQDFKSEAPKVALTAAKCVGVLCVAPAVGYLAYRGGVAAAAELKAYKAAAPARERARRIWAEKQAAARAKREKKQKSKAHSYLAEKQRRENVAKDLAAEKARSKKERKENWERFKSHLHETESDAEKVTWVIEELSKMRKTQLINLETEKEKLDPIWAVHAETFQKMREEKAELEKAKNPDGDLSEKIRVGRLALLTKWLSNPKESLKNEWTRTWGNRVWELDKETQRITIAHNKKFLYTNRPQGLFIANGKEAALWKQKRQSTNKAELESITFIPEITEKFKKEKLQARVAEKTKEMAKISHGMKRPQAEQAAQVQQEKVKISPFSLSNEAFFTYENLRLLEAGPEHVRRLLEEAGKTQEEITEMWGLGLWDAFLQLRKKEASSSSSLALKAWNQVKQRNKNNQLNPDEQKQDQDAAYLDRLDFLAARPKSVSSPAQVFEPAAQEETVVLTPDQTRELFSKNTYHPFPATLSYTFDDKVSCLVCGNEQRFVIRSVTEVELQPSAVGNNRKVQIPLPGTHKLSACGHLICESCLEQHRWRQLNLVADYGCPQCNMPIPYWETDREKWVSHFGIDYAQVASEGSRPFQELRLQELQELHSEFLTSLSGRLGGWGLELEGSFYRTIRVQNPILDTYKDQAIAAWKQHRIAFETRFTSPYAPMDPPVEKKDEAAYEAYMEKIEQDFSTYIEVKSQLADAYIEQVAALAWEIHKPSVNNRNVRNHLKQYQFKFDLGKAEKEEVYKKFSSIQEDAEDSFFGSVQKKIEEIEVASSTGFLENMGLSAAEGVFSAAEEEFKEKLDEQMVLYNGSEEYRSSSYEALRAYAEEISYQLEGAINKLNLKSVFPEFSKKIDNKKDRGMSDFANHIEVVAQELEADYGKVGLQSEEEEKNYRKKVSDCKKDAMDLLTKYKSNLDADIARYHWMSYFDSYANGISERMHGAFAVYRPSNPTDFMEYTVANEAFTIAAKRLTDEIRCNKPVFASVNETGVCVQLERLEASYKQELEAYKKKMQPIQDRTLFADEMATEKRKCKREIEDNKALLAQVLSYPNEESAFCHFQNAILTKLYNQSSYEKKSLAGIKAEIKEQQDYRSFLLTLLQWKKFDSNFEKEVQETYAHIVALAQFFKLGPLLPNPYAVDMRVVIKERLQDFRNHYWSVYHDLLESSHGKQQTLTSYQSECKEMEKKLGEFVKKSVEMIFPPFLSERIEVRFRKWSNYISQEDIKSLLELIDVKRIDQGFSTAYVQILSYVGLLLQEHSNAKELDPLRPLYRSVYVKIAPHLQEEVVYDLPTPWKKFGYVGLYNFGSTCYLNTLYKSFALTDLYNVLSPLHPVAGEEKSPEWEKNRKLQSMMYRLANAIRSEASQAVLTPMLEKTNQQVWDTLSGVDQAKEGESVVNTMYHRDSAEYAQAILNAFSATDLTGIGAYKAHMFAGSTATLKKEPVGVLLPMSLVGSFIPEILKQMGQVETIEQGSGLPDIYSWTRFYRLPSTLVISMNRFDNYGRKLKNPVGISREIQVDGQEILANGQEAQPEGQKIELFREGDAFQKNYALSGIYMHYEGADWNLGHYTFVTQDEKGTFIEHNDEREVRYSEEDGEVYENFKSLLEENAYVVIYREMGTRGSTSL